MTTVGDVYTRLTAEESQWGEDTLKVLNHQCPLSILVNFEAFNRARGLTLPEVISVEHDAVTYMEMKTNNFSIAVDHLLVRKLKSRPEW